MIVEHFRRHVLHELDGQAKAMVVTGSREHALRYYFGVDAITSSATRLHGSEGLVAFSGELDVDGRDLHGSGASTAFPRAELPEQFDRPTNTRF